LRSIEHRADILRLAHAELWLSRDQAIQLVSKHIRTIPLLAQPGRWLVRVDFGVCRIDAECWQRFSLAIRRLRRYCAAKLRNCSAVCGAGAGSSVARSLEKMSDALPPPDMLGK